MFINDEGQLTVGAKAWLTFLGSFVATCAIILIALFLSGSPIHQEVASLHGVVIDSETSPLTASDEEALRRLVQGGQVITAQNLIAQIASYYSGAIKILLALLSAVGLLAFMYVKAVSADHAESAVQKSVNHYFRSRQFLDDVRQPISEAASEATATERQLVRSYIDDLDARLQHFEGWDPDALNELTESVRLIEQEIARADRADQQGEDIQLAKRRSDSGGNSTDG